MDKEYELMDDTELIMRTRKGDNSAKSCLYKKYQNYVNALSKKYYLANCDEDDIFQIASIGFLKSIDSYNLNSATPFILYAKRCINNLIIDCVRKYNTKKNAVNLDCDSLYMPIGDNENSCLIDVLPDDKDNNPESILLEKESEKIVLACLDSLNLSDLERMILNRRKQDKSQLEIACELDIDLRCVDNALRRIKRKYKDRKC